MDKWNIDDVQHPEDENWLEAAHTAQLRGPGTLLKFLDHISLQAAQVDFCLNAKLSRRPTEDPEGAVQ